MTPISRSGWLDWLRCHRVFLSGFGLWLLVAGILLLLISPPEEIFFFNAHRSPAADVLFRVCSSLGGETPGFLVTAVILLLWGSYRALLTVAPLGLSVSVLSYATKQFFAHDRPLLFLRKARLLDLIDPVEGVVLSGSNNSFPSGHTMTAFALCAFIAFCMPQRRIAAAVLLLFAVLAAVSRIYLVQHFLKDVYLGSILGVALAAGWWYGQRWWGSSAWLDGNLRQRL